MAAKLPESQTRAVDDILPDDPNVQYADLDKLTADNSPPEQPEQVEDERDTPIRQPAQGKAEEADDGADGKSVEELRRMYADSQRMIGEQGRELGELRRRADQFIQMQIAAAQSNRAPAQPRKPLEDSDFFAAPSEATKRQIAEHPELQTIRAETARAQAAVEGFRRQQAKAEFERLHPDSAEIIASPEFRQWVGASQIRQSMFQRANANYDFASANELFSVWKDIQAARQPAKDEANKAADARRSQAKKGAKVPTGGNARPADSAQAKPIYRRAQILKLMETDRERYEQLAPEIERAYAEGRVR